MRRVAVLVVACAVAAAGCDAFRAAGDAPNVNGECPSPDDDLVAFYGICAQTCRSDPDCPAGTVCTCGGAWAPFSGGGQDPAAPFGVCVAPCITDDDCPTLSRCRLSTEQPRELTCVDARGVCGADEFCHAACSGDDFCNEGTAVSNDRCEDTLTGRICTTDTACGRQ